VTCIEVFNDDPDQGFILDLFFITGKKEQRKKTGIRKREVFKRRYFMVF
jgi:hypothetical protein